MNNILTIDIEEVFHTQYARNMIRCGNPFRTRSHHHNVDEILKLLDECGAEATFFIAGEVTDRCPYIIRKIVDAGHEVAFHSHDHKPLWEKNPRQLERELEAFNTLLTAITGEKCAGYRAPSFSLDNRTVWALDVLERSGLLYDSSVFPVKTPLYGLSNAPIKPYRPCKTDLLVEDGDGEIWEFPLAVYSFLGLRIPAAGGFYLRAIPRLVNKAIKQLNNQGLPAVVFAHNWELDAKTPKLKLSPFKSFVTYHDIEKTSELLKRLLQNFQFTSFREYMKMAGMI